MPDAWTPKLEQYLDGELPAPEMHELDAHVRECPSCAADVLAGVQLRRAVQHAGRRYAATAELRHRIQKSVQARSRRQPSWLIATAAVTALLIVGTFSVFMGNRRSEQGQLFGELIDLHVATLASANPVDVVSSDRHTVKPWFEGKIPFTFNLPELQNSGFTLIGGRVSYLGESAGAQLLYQIRKHQISVFISQDKTVPGLPSSDAGPQKRDSFDVETWTSGGLRYFVVGDPSPEDIRKLADLLKSVEK